MTDNFYATKTATSFSGYTFNRLDARDVETINARDFENFRFIHCPTLTEKYLENTSDAELCALHELLSYRADSAKLAKVEREMNRR